MLSERITKCRLFWSHYKLLLREESFTYRGVQNGPGASCCHRKWEIQLISKGRDLNLTTFHHALATTVSLQPVTAEARFRSQASLYWICGRRSDIGTSFTLLVSSDHSSNNLPFTPDILMRRLMTGIRSDKCVVRRFRRCAKVIEWLAQSYII